MGILVERSSGRRTVLEPQTVVGRDARCSLRVPAAWVSTQHALVRWAPAGWELRDLSSRNGTFLDGTRVKPGLTYTLREGSRLAFGKRTDQEWVLCDDSRPVAMATPIVGGPPALLEGDFIAIPSAECPAATIFVDGESWFLEDSEGARVPLESGHTFEVNGAAWRFSIPSDVPSATHLGSSLMDLSMPHVHLFFRVSADEEVVDVSMRLGDMERQLGSRNFNYLLLTLARRRIEDRRDGHPESECGWLDYDDMKHDPTMAPPQLNVDVFRIRQHFAKVGVTDAASIIERRPRTRQLRIGTGLLTVITPQGSEGRMP